MIRIDKLNEARAGETATTGPENLSDASLREALRSLPSLERRAFQMRADGKNCQEIATALGVSRSGAQRLASIATQKIKARLKRKARAARGPRGSSPRRKRLSRTA